MKQSKGTWLHAATKRKLVATANFKKSRGGWVAGAGVEAPLWPQWTAKFEYLYSTSAVSRKLCGRRTVRDHQCQHHRAGSFTTNGVELRCKLRSFRWRSKWIATRLGFVN
jgi:opacity protein-like surface antigen